MAQTNGTQYQYSLLGDSDGGWVGGRLPWDTYDPNLNDGNLVDNGTGTGQTNTNLGGWNWGSGVPDYQSPTYPDYNSGSSWLDNIGNNFASLQNSGLLAGLMNGQIWNPANSGAAAQANNGANWWMLGQGAGSSPYASNPVQQSNYQFDPQYWQDMLTNNGRPVDQTAAWAAAKDVGMNALQDAFNAAAEGFSAGHTRFSSGSATQMGESARKAGADLAAQRLNMELQAQEAARQRMMQAMGYDLTAQQSSMQQALSNAQMGNAWNQALLSSDMQARLQALGLLSNTDQFNAQATNQNNQFNAGQANDWYQNLINQDANTRLQSGQLGANYALGLGSQQLQNAQNQYANQLALINAMSGYGQNTTANNEAALSDIYNSTYALLPSALQYALTYPPGSTVQQQSGKGIGSMLGGVGSILSAPVTGGTSLLGLGLSPAARAGK